MDKLIKWLLQNTPDGATYLQVIILGVVFIYAVWGLYTTMKDVIRILKEEDEKDECDAQTL